MKDLKQKLIIEQIDNKLKVYSKVDPNNMPSSGWINTIRTSIKMTLEQLGTRISTSKQGAKKVEEREADGSITINALKEAANALDMDFVYGFKPRKGTILKMIDEVAMTKATEIVMRTSKTMELEDQKVSQDRLDQAIKDKAKELSSNLPKYLWD
ncbi:MAG: mobile mystery protein A [Bacteroidales bacterium]|nr:mobile mystery protein A [Bacteroidales bacterium]